MRLIAVMAILVLAAAPVSAQPSQLPEGLFQGYEGEWRHVSRQLMALAEATPEEKFTWKPADGVRSTSEVYMHIVGGNYLLLRPAGLEVPEDLRRGMEKGVTAKADVIAWLKRSLDAVGALRAKATPEDLQRRVTFFGGETTVEALYLRVIVHANEHMGQLIAYARMSGVVPPWSKP